MSNKCVEYIYYKEIYSLLKRAIISQQRENNMRGIIKIGSMVFFVIIFLSDNVLACKKEECDMKTEQDSLNFEEVQKIEQWKNRIKPEFLKASDKVDLAYYSFLPKSEPKASLIFYHGGGFWSNRLYQKMAQELTEKFPVAVYLADLRGHGNSGGLRGDAPSAQQVWQDIDDTVRFVKQRHSALPLFLGGHSAGAGVILNYSGWQKSNLVDGYFFVAPFLGGDSGTVQPNQRFVKNIKIWAIIANVFSGGWLFNHTKAVFFNYPERLIKQDSYILTSYTTAMAIATSPHDAKSLFRKLKKPCALFVADRDEQFIPEKLIAFKDHLHENIKDKSFAQLICDATHLSIVLKASEFLSQALEKFVSY